jgi:hypothetical protein
VDAKRARLERGDAPFLIGEGGVARCAESHLVREHRPATQIDVVRKEVAATLAKRHAGFVIGADHERQHAETLHGVELLGGLGRGADGHDEAADVLARDEGLHADPSGTRRRRVVAE